LPQLQRNLWIATNIVLAFDENYPICQKKNFARIKAQYVRIISVAKEGLDPFCRRGC
jgi:hypothetical protein